MSREVYSLDTNIFIQPWNSYYPYDIFPDYWAMLEKLGKQGRIFIANEVYKELEGQQDILFDWIKNSGIPVHETTGNITQILGRIFRHHPHHQYLVDNTKGRSMADPFVIAHAIDKNACVVTKELKAVMATSVNAKVKIKIPDVCDNMGIRWTDDIGLIREVGMKFTCDLP